MSNWGTWDRGWNCSQYSILLALSKNSARPWFCKLSGWTTGHQLFPASLITKCSHVIEFWWMTSGHKRSKPFLRHILKRGSCLPSIRSVSPSFCLECDAGLSGLPHPPGLEQGPRDVGQEHRLSPQAVAGTEVPGDPRNPVHLCIYPWERRKLLSGRNHYSSGSFCTVVPIYPKNSVVQVKTKHNNKCIANSRNV